MLSMPMRMCVVSVRVCVLNCIRKLIFLTSFSLKDFACFNNNKKKNNNKKPIRRISLIFICFEIGERERESNKKERAR